MPERESFAQFMDRHPEFAPLPGERMSDVYQKQIVAFSKFADEQVGGLLQLRADVDEIKRFLVL